MVPLWQEWHVASKRWEGLTENAALLPFCLLHVCGEVHLLFAFPTIEGSIEAVDSC